MNKVAWCPMGLVPRLTSYLSSTFIGTEQMGVEEEEREGKTRLSDDKDTVEGVGSRQQGPKRWWWCRQQAC